MQSLRKKIGVSRRTRRSSTALPAVEDNQAMSKLSSLLRRPAGSALIGDGLRVRILIPSRLVRSFCRRGGSRAFNLIRVDKDVSCDIADFVCGEGDLSRDQAQPAF